MLPGIMPIGLFTILAEETLTTAGSTLFTTGANVLRLADSSGLA
jgi:hypothetical protein